MPTSPKPVVPRSRPASTDDASVKLRDTTAPTRAQNAPIAKYIAIESLGTADIAWSLLVAAITPGLPFTASTPTLRGSGQQALDLLAHPVDLVRRHVRVQRQGQGFPARGHGVLHPLAHPMRHPSQKGLLVDGRIEVALGLDPARREARVHCVPAGPGPCGDEEHEVVPAARPVGRNALHAASREPAEPRPVDLDELLPRLHQL